MSQLVAPRAQAAPARMPEPAKIDEPSARSPPSITSRRCCTERGTKSSVLSQPSLPMCIRLTRRIPCSRTSWTRSSTVHSPFGLPKTRSSRRAGSVASAAGATSYVLVVVISTPSPGSP